MCVSNCKGKTTVAVSIQQRRTKEGVAYITATVRVTPYPSASKTFPNKREAKEWAREQERELKKQADRGAIRSDVPKLTVAQLLREFLEDPTTQALGYHKDLNLLCAWWSSHCGTEKVMEFNVLKVRKARDVLKPGRAAGTVNRYLSAMRSAWNWGRAAGLVPQEHAWPARVMLKEPKGRVRFLSDAELTSLREAVTEVYGPQLFALTMVSIATGVRQSELLRLKWLDVNFKQSKVTVLLTKNSESRSVYLPSAASNALQDLRKLDIVSPTHVFVDPRDGKPFDKNKLRYRWKLARKAAALKDFTWHDLRHSCASLLAQNGATLLEIGAVLGHKSPAATMRYAHLVQGAPVTGHSALDQKLKG